ncbi:MAG: PatB family C-S lyase [Deinococcales bacterium]
MHPFDKLSIDSLSARPNMKWQKYPQGVLPLWVADMDFPTSSLIIEALRQCAEENNLVYQDYEGIAGLKDAIITRQAERYYWQLEPQDIWLVHGVIPAMFLANLALASSGEATIMQTPIYPPFMMSVENTGRKLVTNPLVYNSSQKRWEIDFEALEAQITPETRLFMLCNPHNPTGRVFSRAELEQLAEIILKHRLWVLSDELHSDLTFGQKHIPFASISDDIAMRTATIFGPTKAFNIAGLKIGILVAQNPQLMKRLKDIGFGLLMAPNIFAQVATLTAYTQADDWLADTVHYLDGNRQLIKHFMAEKLPQVRHDSPEGTYLAWFDFGGLELNKLENILIQDCKLGLNMGDAYGPGGAGFARFNFATSKAIVQEGLDRLFNGLKPYLD